MLRNRLASFSIDFDSQIVSIVTDGCSQMTKLGRIVNVDQQLCHAHGANLAVQDTFYKQEKNNNSSQNTDQNSIQKSCIVTKGV